MDFKWLFAGLASVLLTSFCDAQFEYLCPSTIGLFPDIRNSECTTFWRCIPTIAIREACPTGEKFDYVIRQCVTELTQLQCDDQRGVFLHEISFQTNNGGDPLKNGNEQQNNGDCHGNNEAVTAGPSEHNPTTPPVEPTVPLSIDPAGQGQITEVQSVPTKSAPVVPVQPVAAIPQQPLYYPYGYPSNYIYYRFARRYGRSIRDPLDNAVMFDLPEGIKVPTRGCEYIENVLNRTLRQLVTSITGNGPCSRENCLLPGIRIRCQSNQ